MDELEKMFDQQKFLSNRINNRNDRYPTSKPGRISVLSTAIIHEAVELQRLTDWKWWKEFRFFPEDEAKEELIDIWHFVIQASIELEMTPEEVLSKYLEKNLTNQKRQDDGY